MARCVGMECQATSSERTLFVEYDEFLAGIHRLIGSECATPDERASMVAALSDILGKYQEQPTLLDRHLSDAVRAPTD